MVEGDTLTPSPESPSPGYPDPIGCFKDTADDRVLTAKISSDTMTPTVRKSLLSVIDANKQETERCISKVLAF